MTMRVIDPDDECFVCEGKGFLAHPEYGPAECWACQGQATAGVYVVQLNAGEVCYEISWQTADLADAIRRARRSATLAALRVRRFRFTDARVVYIPRQGRPVVVRKVPVPKLLELVPA